jgi:hypothetical protein
VRADSQERNCFIDDKAGKPVGINEYIGQRIPAASMSRSTMSLGLPMSHSGP